MHKPVERIRRRAASYEFCELQAGLLGLITQDDRASARGRGTHVYPLRTRWNEAFKRLQTLRVHTEGRNSCPMGPRANMLGPTYRRKFGLFVLSSCRHF
jgi:hypothetical protein